MNEEAVSWPEWDLNPRPLNSFQTRLRSEHSEPTLYSCSNFIFCSVFTFHFGHPINYIYIIIMVDLSLQSVQVTWQLQKKKRSASDEELSPLVLSKCLGPSTSEETITNTPVIWEPWQADNNAKTVYLVIFS